MYSDKDIKRQLLLGEDSTREFKQISLTGKRLEKPHRDSLANTIAAFANARGGTLLCGVTDTGDVQGLSQEDMSTLDDIVAGIATDVIRPAVRIHTYHVALDGKLLLLVDIPQGEEQHDSLGGAFVRVGASIRQLTNDERLRLAQRRGQARFRSYDEQPVPCTGYGTLDASLWRPLLSAEGARNPKSALRKLALLTDDEAGIQRATVAGILLCTQRPEQWLRAARITATRYRGSNRASGQVDGQEITGPLNRQIADALAFAARNMQVAARKDPGRVDQPQYSNRALFESVVNAVVHRDYSMRSKIRLSMFEDRLELQSPGALPNNLTIESMADRESTRNEALASVLGRMQVEGVHGSRDRIYFMESRGDGVAIIHRETTELAGKSPMYRLIDESELCLTLPSAIREPSAARTVVCVRSAGQPLQRADVLVLFPNKTWKRAATDQYGEAPFELHTTLLPTTVYVAAPGFGAHVEHGWVPSRRALAVELDVLPEGGSKIFPEGTGHLPGLMGRLSPILDSLERTYLYASNIAVNEGRAQPVYFVPGEDMRLTDAEGKEMSIRVVAITGRSALVEYRPFQLEQE